MINIKRDTLTLWKAILIVSVSSILSFRIFSFEVTHQLKPNSSFEQMSLNSSCSTMEGFSFSTQCNPALFSYSDKSGISLSIVGKSDGDSIDNGRELIFEPISEQLLRKLFQEKNFNSFTFNSSFIFKTKYFNLTYSPYYLMADLYIFNPAFPEVSLNLANRETLRITSGSKIGSFSLYDTNVEASIGGSLYYFEHQYENTVFSIFDLSFQKPEDLIKIKTVYGLSGDIGLFVNNNSSYIPKLAIQIKNIEQKKEQFETVRSSVTQQAAFLFETYSSLGLGSNYTTFLGDFSINLEVPFYDYFSEISVDHSMLGIRYSIKLFSVVLSASKYYKNASLSFKSKNFNVGISYSREEDMGKLQSTQEDSIYTGLDILL